MLFAGAGDEDEMMDRLADKHVPVKQMKFTQNMLKNVKSG